MEIDLELTTEQQLQLLNFCSHVLEDLPAVRVGLEQAGKNTESINIATRSDQVQAILAQVDKAYPALISLPKDGKSWSER